MTPLPWLDAKTYYRRRWGEPVGRVGLDGGFSCPNRGPDRRAPGCAFCTVEGNLPPYQTRDAAIEDQVRQGVDFQASRYGTKLFSAYFQSFSATWAPVETLRRVYDRALGSGRFVELTVGTRPDCVPEEVADLLSEYRSTDREVWVELGLQSSRDETLARIGRGHQARDFTSAAKRLKARAIPFTAHLMYGLPGEGADEFLASARFAWEAGASGIKLHDLLLVPGTRLYSEWQAGRMAPVDAGAYLDAAAEVLVRVPSGTVVWRVRSDSEDRRNRSESGRTPKNRFLSQLAEEVRKRQAL